MLQDVEPSSPLHEDVGEINAAAERAASLTRQLLTFSRRQPSSSRSVDLGDVVSGVEELLRRLIQANVELHIETAPGLRGVNCDPSQLEQVIVNLAMNACDAMSKGGRIVIRSSARRVSSSECARLGLDAPGSYEVIDLSDTGEADEAFGTFRHLSLDALLITNIEADHLDHYGTVAALEDAFAQVAGRVAGPKVVCIDDAGVRRLAQTVDVITYGFAPDAQWRITDLTHDAGAVSFHLEGDEESVDVTLPKPGEHLALNAAGVLALLGESDMDVAAAAAALRDFKGVRRRYEITAMVDGITIVDDYAHHPTEVAATIAAASTGSSGKVIAVFQPHRYTRTADLAPEFGAPLALADQVIVSEIYAAGERPIIGVTGRLVSQSVEAAGGNVSFIPRLADIPVIIAANAQRGDVVLLLGAGDVSSISGDVVLAIEAER